MMFWKKIEPMANFFPRPSPRFERPNTTSSLLAQIVVLPDQPQNLLPPISTAAMATPQQNPTTAAAGDALRVADLQGRGRGLVAARNVREGEVLLSESPILLYPRLLLLRLLPLALPRRCRSLPHLPRRLLLLPGLRGRVPPAPPLRCALQRRQPRRRRRRRGGPRVAPLPPLRLLPPRALAPRRPLPLFGPAPAPALGCAGPRRAPRGRVGPGAATHAAARLFTRFHGGAPRQGPRQ
jgi:hypothetical protein